MGTPSCPNKQAPCIARHQGGIRGNMEMFTQPSFRLSCPSFPLAARFTQQQVRLWASLRTQRILPINAGDAGSVPESGRSPVEANGNQLKCSHLGNPMDRGAWRSYSPRLANVLYVTQQPKNKLRQHLSEILGQRNLHVELSFRIGCPSERLQRQNQTSHSQGMK